MARGRYVKGHCQGKTAGNQYLPDPAYLYHCLTMAGMMASVEGNEPSCLSQSNMRDRIAKFKKVPGLDC